MTDETLEEISDTDPIPSDEGVSSEAPQDDEPNDPEEFTSDPK